MTKTLEVSEFVGMLGEVEIKKCPLTKKLSVRPFMNEIKRFFVNLTKT
jgi:hypothetical protein